MFTLNYFIKLSFKGHVHFVDASLPIAAWLESRHVSKVERNVSLSLGTVRHVGDPS